MASISSGKLRRSGFYNDVSAKGEVQDINLNQLKLKVEITNGMYEKKTRKIEAVDVEDVINKTYLDSKLQN